MPSRNSRVPRISSRTNLGTLYRLPRTRRSARSRASQARLATNSDRLIVSTVSSHRFCSSDAAAGSPTRIVHLSGARARIRYCRSRSGSRGSPSFRRSISRTERFPSRWGASQATRRGTRTGSSDLPIRNSRSGSIRHSRLRRREAGMHTTSLATPGGLARSIHASSNRRSRLLDASTRNTTGRSRSAGQPGSSRPVSGRAISAGILCGWGGLCPMGRSTLPQGRTAPIVLRVVG